MTETPDVDELAATVRKEPQSVDLRALAVALSSDDYETSSEANDVLDELIDTVAEPLPLVEWLLDLTEDDQSSVRRNGIKVLQKFVRVWPREVTPRVAREIQSASELQRAAALATLQNHGGAVRVYYVDAVADRLGDPDPRIAALACSVLESISSDFPQDVAEYVPELSQFLDDRWIPENSGGMQKIYSQIDHEGDEESGEPPGERLTHTISRPFESALNILIDVARVQPEAVEPQIPRLGDLVNDLPPRNLASVLTVLTYIARTDPESVASVVPSLRTLTEQEESRRIRVLAQNLLTELDFNAPETNSLPVPALVERDRPSQEADEEVLSGIDQRALRGDLDVDEVLDLLHCQDSQTRDTAAWGLDCGGGRYVNEIQDRAEAFLALVNEPHDCTRKHLARISGPVAALHPSQWVPPLIDLTKHENPKVRSMALRVLSWPASSYPALVSTYREEIKQRLDDDPAVRVAAFNVLEEFVEFDPRSSAPLMHKAIAEFEAEEPCGSWDVSPRLQALHFLTVLAKVDPVAVLDAAEQTRTIVQALASEEVIEQRACRGKGNNRIELHDADRSLKQAFELLFYLTKENADAGAPVKDHAERVVRGRYYGQKNALKVLVALDRA